MSAQTAGWQGAGSGKRRLMSLIGPSETRPVRLTIRRVKFAGSLFVGALMLGVVSNAMLLQPPATLRVASSAAPQRPDIAPFPAPPQETAAPVHDRAPGPAPTRTADPMPVGSIAPVIHSKLRPAPVAAKPRLRKSDAIGAFLKAGKIR